MISKDDILRRKQMWDSVEDDIHVFFRERGFVHFKTPLIVPSPGMEPNLDPFEIDLRVQNPSMLLKAGLITSPEYSMKKLLGEGFERIYTITPVFRNNESGGLYNIPEFTMLEWYAPGKYEDLMNETEDLLKHVLKNNTDWPRLTHDQARVDQYGDPHVQEKRFFIEKYPVKKASLAKLSSDGKYAERFEAFGDGMELCNGFSELTDPIEQRWRFKNEKEQRRALGKTVFPIDEELLEALGKINGPVYGNALGIDRLVMLKYGIRDINDIQIFPYA